MTNESLLQTTEREMLRLRRLADRALAQVPDAAFFAGPALPWFETEPPRWLESIMPFVQGAFAVRNYGAEEFALTHEKVPYHNQECFSGRQQVHPVPCVSW